MNWVHLLVEVVKETEQYSYNEKIVVTKYLVKFPKNIRNLKKNKKAPFIISIWQNPNQLFENERHNETLLYNQGDLIIVEGFLSFDNQKSSKLQRNGNFEIRVFKRENIFKI